MSASIMISFCPKDKEGEAFACHLEEGQLPEWLLGSNNALLNTTWLYKGTVNCTSVRVGEVFREAIRRQAAAGSVHPFGHSSYF